MPVGVNLGSGQRPFQSMGDWEWINIDSQEQWNPDHCCDIRNTSIETGTVDTAVLHHCLEHFNLTDGGQVVREAHRMLRPGGSLLIFLPDMKALSTRWLAGGISDYIFFVNAMGAWMGHDEDYHRWHYTVETLTEQLNNSGQWSEIKPFDWRSIPGADIARDWWILGMEGVK